MHRTTIKWFATNRSILCICTAWLCGIICGCFLAVAMNDTYFLLLQNASGRPVTIGGLAVNVILPTAIIASASILHLPWLMVTTVFSKITVFTACFVGIQFIYDAAGWLVRFFVMFSDLMILPVICWLSLAHCARPISKTAVCAIFVWCVLVCLADYFIISPFFADLIGN